MIITSKITIKWKQVVLFGFLFFIGSVACEDQEEIIEVQTADELASQLSEDKDFQNLILANLSFEKDILLSAFRKAITEKMDRTQINVTLEINDHYKNSEILNNLKKVHKKFPQLKNYDDATTILGEAQFLWHEARTSQKTWKSRVGSSRGDDSCQGKFNKEIRRIHREYDEGVRNCAIVTLATWGAGFVPCNAVNVYRASSGTYGAVQAYYQCKDAQQVQRRISIEEELRGFDEFLDEELGM
ncbi:MAG: hypothetical protein OXH57_10020 [Ekhidna sp.]|nr:hypothetical protein [Ekhidna sp.]